VSTLRIVQVIAGEWRAEFLEYRNKNNGVTEGELIETITHLAFYAGWPNAVTAIGVARDVFKR
jgi:alkylhydroperoxidase/carboxymuconolactone decarboxylase family protein YurZ